MSYIALIIIGLVIIGFLFTLVVKALESIASFLNTLINEISKISIGRILGRRAFGAELNIDSRLSYDTFRIERDNKIEILKKYKPEIVAKNNYNYLHYVIDLIQQERKINNQNSLLTLDIIKSILITNKESAITKLTNLQKQKKSFPVLKPKFISKLTPVPLVEIDKNIDINIPSIKLPLYKIFPFLNKFVLNEFKNEIKKINDFIKKREILIDIFEKQELQFNLELLEANKRYEAAVIQEKNNYLSELNDWELNKVEWEKCRNEELNLIKNYIDSFSKNDIELQSKVILNTIESLDWVPNNFEVKYDFETKILIVEHEFIDIGSISLLKEVVLKSGKKLKPLNQKEYKEAINYIYPSISLRLIYELASQISGDVEAIAINGWTNYIVKSTGNLKRAYCCSLIAKVEEIKRLNLLALDAVSAFDSLKGVVARSFEVTPIAPSIRINDNDTRFIAEREVLNKLDSSVNLAIMDWDDFEHLCRQLFEKQFASVGATVKVTQASRDKGVDAIVFDPDPVRGGKIVIQAKRYVNTVDVSAVRDLYGTVMNEGAMKGILVTTSQYGPEAYTFVKDKPLTLINGNELLSLLEKNGYKFRINLEEARKYLKDNNSFETVHNSV